MSVPTNYQKLAELAQRKLENSLDWEADYARYISAIKDVQEKRGKRVLKNYSVQKPLYEYTTIGSEGTGKSVQIYSQLRYKGQIVGYLYADEERVWLKIDEICAENNRHLMVPPQFSMTEEEQSRRVGTAGEYDWNSSREAHDFREFFRNFHPDKDGRPEHELESALLTELNKRSSLNKSLPGIQPVLFAQDGRAGKRFQLPTKFKGSSIENNDPELAAGRGGGIDILARRARKGVGADLAVIELKDKNERGENPEQAIRQAIVYGVFLRKLLRSDLTCGEDWYHLFGFSGKLPNALTIKCVVAMPDISDVNCLQGEMVRLDDDILELHCICVDKETGRVTGCSEGF